MPQVLGRADQVDLSGMPLDEYFVDNYKIDPDRDQNM